MGGGLNPLNYPGEVFDLGLMNPNPTSSKNKEGPVYRVSFEVEREVWDWFMEAESKGMLIAAKACVTEDAQMPEGEPPEKKPKKPPKGPYSEQAQALHKSGFLLIPAVIASLGSDTMYAAWVSRQKCIICRDGDYDKDGELRNEPAHVLRAQHPPARQGQNPNKPAYQQVPMCHQHHLLQHNGGETAACLVRKVNPVSQITTAEAKLWFDNQRNTHVQKWAAMKLKEMMEVESLTDVEPYRIYVWAESIGQAKMLPPIFKQV